MSAIPLAPRYPGLRKPPTEHRPSLWHILRLVFYRGPKVLLTSQISEECAVSMIVMCSPALLFSALLTLPQLIFRSPRQQAYYYFSQVLDQDPTRWVVLILVSVCVIVSLALPAVMPKPSNLENS
jgi:hypothetical protein